MCWNLSQEAQRSTPGLSGGRVAPHSRGMAAGAHFKAGVGPLPEPLGSLGLRVGTREDEKRQFPTQGRQPKPVPPLCSSISQHLWTTPRPKSRLTTAPRARAWRRERQVRQ